MNGAEIGVAGAKRPISSFPPSRPAVAVPRRHDAARSVRERADFSARIGLEGVLQPRCEAFAESRQVGEGVGVYAAISPFIKRGRSRSRARASCRLRNARLRNWLHIGITVVLNLSNSAGGGILNSNPRRYFQSALGIFEPSLMVFDASEINSSLDRRSSRK